MYLLLHILILAAAIQALDEEDMNKRIEEENDKFTENERRFNENLNDEDWHIAHLKSTDFEDTRRSGCVDLPFKEKVKKYRRNLKKDAGQLKYVFAQPLPFDEKDLDNHDCNKVVDMRNETDLQNSTIATERTAAVDFRANATNALNITTTTDLIDKESDEVESTESLTNNSRLTANTSELIGNESQLANSSEEAKSSETDVPKPRSSEHDPAPNVKYEEMEAVVDQATPTPVKKKKKKENVQRRDYLFSSAEYDDDVVDFDGSECPDLVEVITLELDLIRSYDVECELSLQWRSLE